MIHLVIAVASALLVHDGDPSHDAWFESLKQPENGASCCSTYDCHEVPDGEYRVRSGHYEFHYTRSVFGDMANEKWLPIPEEKWLRGKNNPTGALVVCGINVGVGFAVWCAVEPWQT